MSAAINLRRWPQNDVHSNRKAWGYFQLFNVGASALKGRDTVYSEEYLSAGYVDLEFLKLWPDDRRYFTGIRVVHIDHGDRGRNWHGEV